MSRVLRAVRVDDVDFVFADEREQLERDRGVETRAKVDLERGNVPLTRFIEDFAPGPRPDPSLVAVAVEPVDFLQDSHFLAAPIRARFQM